jgi:hypothetical protein
MKSKTIQVFGEVGIDTINEGVELSTLVFEFIHTGKVYTNRYGDVQFSQEQLEEMATNFNDGVAGMEIAVDINHDPEKRAYAWIAPQSLYVAPSRNEVGQYSLYGKLHRYTPEGEHFVRTGAFRYFSIEVHYDVKRYIAGKLKVFKNVLMGLALTNFPAIKGLSPTFSDTLISNKNANMETLKIFLSALASKETVSKEEKTLLSTMVASLSDEEKEEINEEVAEVEAKPEEVIEDKKAETEDKALSDAIVTKLADSNKKLSEQVATLMRDKKALKLSEARNSVMLSDTNTTGFTKDSEADVEAFMESLSDEQLGQFKSLVSKVKTVQLGEVGAVTKPEDNTDVDSKAIALSEEILKANPSMPKWKALSEAYTKLGA